MLLDDLASCVDASCSESLISRQFHLRLQPELGFTAGMLHMDVWARFFAREEVEPVPANTEDSGTHVSRISDSLGRSTSGRTFTIVGLDGLKFLKRLPILVFPSEEPVG